MFDKQKLTQLLNKPMNRRDFLRNIGILLISMIGLRSALSILATGKPQSDTAAISFERKHGFGGGRFGV